LRLRTTFGDSVSTAMPSAAGSAQAAIRLRAFSTSTMQIRQAPVGVTPLRWQSVGMSMPCRRATARMVSPSAKSHGVPSIVIVRFFSIGDPRLPLVAIAFPRPLPRPASG
jgi:hypothetical protein